MARELDAAAKKGGCAISVTVSSTRPQAAPPVAYQSEPLGATQPKRARAVASHLMAWLSVIPSGRPGVTTTVGGGCRHCETHAESVWFVHCQSTSTPATQDGATCRFQPSWTPNTPPSGACV